MNDEGPKPVPIPFADITEAVMTELEAFGDHFARLARTKEQTALAEHFGNFISETYALITKLVKESSSAMQTLPSPGDHPPHPWPSEMAKANRHQPGQDHGKSDGKEHSHGRNDGHSM